MSIFSIPMNGPTTVVFYNKSKTFTANDVYSGEFRIWLEQTYLWWSTLNPCSTTATQVTTTQVSTQQAAQQATSAAAAATAATPPPTNTATNNSSSTDSNSTSTSEISDNSTTETKSEETKSEETKTEETKEETKEEETKEEEKKEEKEEEKEEEKKKKEKKDLPPPIVTANVAMMQGPDGTYSYATTFGVSRSSLMGDKSYGVSTMIWSNLQQFMLTGNFTKVHINKKGRVSRVYSASMGLAKMYSTLMVTVNNSWVFLGKKGSAAGIAVGNNVTSLDLNVIDGNVYYNETVLGQAVTLFYTKTIAYSSKITLTPMLAASIPFLSVEVQSHRVNWNIDTMFIGGLSGTFNLTRRFGFNLGTNIVTSTQPNFPLLVNFTIGSKFNF